MTECGTHTQHHQIDDLLSTQRTYGLVRRHETLGEDWLRHDPA